MYLPDELVHEILVRSPPKALIKFRCVCKSWNSLISSSEFISLHIKSYTKSTVLYRRSLKSDPLREEVYSIHDDNEAFGTLGSGVCLPFRDYVGTDNGLVCLQKVSSNKTNVMLWNPCIRKYCTLPEPASVWSNCITGFGYDVLSDDYKVLTVCLPVYETGQVPGHAVEIFSLRARRWRVLPLASPFVGFGIGSSCRCVGGVIYWLAWKSENDGTKLPWVVSFDLSSERFSDVKVPSRVLDPKNRSVHNIRLTTSQDSLAIIVKSRLSEEGSNFYFWVLKKGGAPGSCWIKLFTVEAANECCCRPFPGLTKNGFVVVADRAVCRSTVATRRPVFVNLRPRDCGDDKYRLIESFKESFVLLQDGDYSLSDFF